MKNIDEFGDFWASKVYPYVKPIVEADPSQQACPVGSGVLVSRHQKQYLVTAHHVTAYAQGTLYTFAPEQVELTGMNHHVPDPFDLVLFEIPASGCSTLRLPQLLSVDVLDGEPCLLLGFPARSKSWEIDPLKQSLRPGPLSYVGVVAKESELRFTVRFHEKRLYRNGKRQPPVGKLNGISGGGVFVIRNETPKLSGIVIEYHRRAAEIVCTSSRVVWEMVRRISV